MEDKQEIQEFDNDSLDQSGPNYSQADPDGQPDDNKKPKPDAFALLVKILFNPVEGWKSVRRSGLSPETAQQSCLYPLLAIYACSKFADLFYTQTASVSSVLVNAVIAFVSFFAGYFCIMIILKAVLPAQSVEGKQYDFLKVFVLLMLSSLCIFFTAIELLPMLWAILIFLPLWTIYAICRGARFFRFPDRRQISCTAALTLAIVGIPPVLDWLLGEMLPK